MVRNTVREARITGEAAGSESALREVMGQLRGLVAELVPRHTETVNAWRIPTILADGPLCYFMLGKKHITLGFHRGAALTDPAGLLEGTGKSLRHVKVRTLDDVKRPELRRLILAAARLNRKDPQPASRGMGGPTSR